MKKSFLWLLLALAGVTSFVSCDNEEGNYIDRDIVPVDMEIRISDAEGRDLLDSQNEAALWNRDYEITWNGNVCKFATIEEPYNMENIIERVEPTEEEPGNLTFRIIGWAASTSEASGNIVISWDGGAETTEITYDVVRKKGVLVSEAYTVNGVPVESSADWDFEVVLSIVK